MIKIVLHGGSAHTDDYLSACILLSIFKDRKVVIRRRDPKPEEFQDNNVFIIDVGGKHEPTFSNFDHHQFPADHEPTCALSLVLKHFDLYGIFSKYFKWLKFVERLDCRGPFNYCKEEGLSPDQFFAMESIIQKSSLALFERFYKESFMQELMRTTGDYLIRSAKECEERWKILEEESKFWSVGAINICSFEADVHSPSFQLNEWLDTLDNEYPITITNDDRGGGTALFRRNDDERVNFCLIKDDPRVLFAHNNGFCAKTKTKLSNQSIKELIKKSIVK